MISFMVGVALMLLLALLFVVLPLTRRAMAAGNEAQRTLTLAIHRDALAELDRDLASGLIDPEQYRISCAELERRVLDEAGAAPVAVAASQRRWLPFVAALSVPVVAVPVYLALGSPGAIEAPRRSEPAAAQQAPVTPEQIAAMVDRLAERLKGEPDNAEGWSMLARSYFAMGRFDEAVSAYEKLAALVPNDAQVWVDYADALAMRQERKLAGEPERMLLKALELDPDNMKALALAGGAAMQRGDVAAAHRHWDKLLTMLPADSPLVQPIKDSLAQLEAGAKDGK